MNPVPVPDDAAVRIRAVATPVPESLLRRLRDICTNVSTAADDLAEHGRDWWPLTMGWAIHDRTIPTMPAVVVTPSSTAEVQAVVQACDAHAVALTAAGGRSGVCGASLPVHGGVSLDLTGLRGITDVDATSGIVDVRAGTFGDAFEAALRADHGMTCGHWPQSIALSTVGGWVACRGAGQYSTRYGKIEDMVLGLEVVLADGRVIRVGGNAPRQAVGPDLTQLFVGSEGTLGIITEARLRVHPLPPAVRTRAYGFASFASGLDACRRILRRGATPAVLRLYDERESKRSYATAPPTCVLLVLDEADDVIADAVMAVVDAECAGGAGGAAPLDPALVDGWLAHRNDVSQLESVIRNNIVVDTIEIAARWSALPSLFGDVIAAIEQVPSTLVASCHQSHAYPEGACLYFTFAGRPPSEERDRYYRDVWNAVTRETMRAGGAISHHHGIGLNRSRFMDEALGPAMDVLRAVKHALDPRAILNPGKLGLPDPFGPVQWM